MRLEHRAKRTLQIIDVIWKRLIGDRHVYSLSQEDYKRCFNFVVIYLRPYLRKFVAEHGYIEVRDVIGEPLMFQTKVTRD